MLCMYVCMHACMYVCMCMYRCVTLVPGSVFTMCVPGVRGSLSVRVSE